MGTRDLEEVLGAMRSAAANEQLADLLTTILTREEVSEVAERLYAVRCALGGGPAALGHSADALERSTDSLGCRERTDSSNSAEKTRVLIRSRKRPAHPRFSYRPPVYPALESVGAAVLRDAGAANPAWSSEIVPKRASARQKKPKAGAGRDRGENTTA